MRRPLQTPTQARARLAAAGQPVHVLGVASSEGIPLIAVEDIPCFAVVHADGTTEFRDDDASCRECLARPLCTHALKLFQEERVLAHG